MAFIFLRRRRQTFVYQSASTRFPTIIPGAQMSM
jgi:hypothetical protein